MHRFVGLVFVGFLACSSSSGPSVFGADPAREAGVVDATEDADAMGCTLSFSTAQYGSLADIQGHPPCAQTMGARQFPTCQGYITVGTTGGIDCGSFWVFDAATGALVYFASGCNLQDECWSAMPGFQTPPLCDGAPIDLCVRVPEAGAKEAGIDATADGAGD